MQKYKDNMQEGYLDSEGKFYDYGTELISGNNVIDTKHTGMSFYDDFLDPKNAKYMLEEKNLKGKIVMMSPEQYYEECARVCWPGRNVTVEKLKYERGVLGKNTINKLKQVVQHYKRRLCMPMINYTDPGQEGLHRMYVVGELYGWDFKVPVLIVTYADEERAKKAAEEKRKQEIDWKVESAIQQALRYKYRNKKEVEEQLQWSLSEKFKFWEEIKVPDEITLEETDNSLVLTFEGYEYPIEKDEIEWEEVKQELDDEIEDEIDSFDLDDIEDFLRRHFGDNWRETHPHLKDVFGIKESFNNSNNVVYQCAKEARNYITNKYGTETDLCGRCIEASDYLVKLLNDKGVKAQTVEGYVVYDIDENCSDRAWDEHTWVELEDGTVVDVTVEQFNYQMYEDYPPILIEKDPHGYVYEKPNFSWLDELNESADELTTVGLGIKLRKDIEKGWSKETCHPAYQSRWSLEYPSMGQCAITAMWLNENGLGHL